MAAEGLPVEVACRVLGVSESRYYAWRSRVLSVRAIRHAWLTELIRKVHADARGVYGYRRVHAELTLGHGFAVGHEAVYRLGGSNLRATIQGCFGRCRSSGGRRQVPDGDKVLPPTDR
jgi:hypothetical protein